MRLIIAASAITRIRNELGRGTEGKRKREGRGEERKEKKRRGFCDNLCPFCPGLGHWHCQLSSSVWPMTEESGKEEFLHRLENVEAALLVMRLKNMYAPSAIGLGRFYWTIPITMILHHDPHFQW